MKEEDDFIRYKLHYSAELERQNNEIEALKKVFQQMQIDNAVGKTKLGLIQSLISAGLGVIAAVATSFFTKH